VGILADTSGSRRDDPSLPGHYDALNSFLSKLPGSEDRAYVVAFNDSPFAMSDPTADPAALSTDFENLKKSRRFGSTALYDAIKASAKANFFGRPGRHIIIVGDWEDNSSRASLEVTSTIAQKSAAAVYAIVDGGRGSSNNTKTHKRGLQAAERITKETGGFLCDVEDKRFCESLVGDRERDPGFLQD